MDRKQIRPIARNLKAPAPPKFISQNDDADFVEPTATTFKSNMLVTQSTQKVRISHYEKGVHLFYVQVESLDAQLQALMSQLQRATLINLRSRPSLLGMACLAKHHKKIYRVAIAKVLKDHNQNHSQDNALCNFVDYGFTASVKMDNLFYIPEEFLNQPIFAMPFSFSQLKNITFKSSIQEINYYFKEISEDRLLSLKCVNYDGPPLCQYCELHDGDKNILDLLKLFNSSSLSYLLPSKLEIKKDYAVKVCYVESAQEFYVQLQDTESLLRYDMLYVDLQRQLQNAPTLHNLKPNLCVGVSIESEWYRGKIIELCNNNSFARVAIIDFGIVEEVSVRSIRLLSSKFLAIPSFAFRCCLNGFQCVEVSENITTQFEIFCSDGHGDRKVFKMRIESEIGKTGLFVELFDSNTPPTHVNQMLLKNSRPLAETITLENARKRQKESQKKAKENQPLPEEMSRDVKSPEKGSRNNAQRGRGTSVPKGLSRSSPGSNNSSVNSNTSKRQRTHFDKINGLDGNANAIGGTYFKTTKEATVWGTGNGDTKPNQQQKSADWNAQAKNITREQNSDSDWNETENGASKKSSNSTSTPQKSKSSKSASKKSSDNDSSKQKSPPKQEKVSKQKSPPADDGKKLKNGWVSTLISTNEAYVHFEEHLDGLEKILDELFGFYETQKSSLLRNPKVGLIAAFKSRQDSNWYRCEILSIEGDNIKLRNLEYGNVESVERVNMRVLDACFKKYGRLVEKAFFNIKSNNCNDDILLKEMLKLFNEGTKELKFDRVKNFKDGWILDPIDPENGENLLNVLVEKRKLAVRISDDELKQILEGKIETEKEIIPKKVEAALEVPPPEADSKPQVTAAEVAEEATEEEEGEEIKVEPPKPIAQLKESDKIAAKLTALTSPNDFYLTRVDLLSLFNQLHTDIQILAPAMQPLIDFEYGTFCLAQEPFDTHDWYRAKIIDSDESEHFIITVLCIDNGKTFSIDNKMCLKDMPEQLQQKTSFGIPCSLSVKIERKFEDEATELMLKMVENEVEYKVTLEAPQKHYVELFNKSENIADLLVEKKFAKRLPTFPSGTGYTSHINSTSSFYVQLEVDQLKLDLIASIMERADGKFAKVCEPTVFQVVAAKFPDDDCWYRSRIDSIDEDGYVVTFIDYGNACVVKEIGVIDESITELPAMSKACALAKPKGVANFSEAAEKKFLEITANGATILQIKVIKPGEEFTEVELFCDGQNINDLLAPLCNFEGSLNEF